MGGFREEKNFSVQIILVCGAFNDEKVKSICSRQVVLLENESEKGNMQQFIILLAERWYT